MILNVLGCRVLIKDNQGGVKAVLRVSPTRKTLDKGFFAELVLTPLDMLACLFKRPAFGIQLLDDLRYLLKTNLGLLVAVSRRIRLGIGIPEQQLTHGQRRGTGGFRKLTGNKQDSTADQTAKDRFSAFFLPLIKSQNRSELKNLYRSQLVTLPAFHTGEFQGFIEDNELLYLIRTPNVLVAEHKKTAHGQYFIQVVSLNIRYDILDIKPETMVGLMQSVIIQVYAAYLLIML